MILEKIYYEEDFPLNIFVGEIEEYPIHYHKDVEIVYVLQGEIEIKNGTCDYILKTGDTFVNNGHEVHGLHKTDKHNVVAIIRISNLYFTQFFPDLIHSCYTAYSSRQNDPRLDELRTNLLIILLTYYQGSYDYKAKCIELTINLISLLNRDFNIFAFEEHIIVNFKNRDPIIKERVSNITKHLYEHHASKITLEDLAEMEHLSTFYMSHLIKENVGMSFRDFLCFARIEWSEISLLGTSDKISTVAKKVGFSTTAYFEKYFKTWFHRSPAEHREIYRNLVLSPERQPSIRMLPASRTLPLIKHCLMELTSQDRNNIIVHHFDLETLVPAGSNTLSKFDKKLEVVVTIEDYKYMQYKLFDTLKNIKCSKVVLQTKQGDAFGDINELKNRLNAINYDVQILSTALPRHQHAYALDSVAFAIYIMKKEIESDDPHILAFLRDQGDDKIILKGCSSILTSGLIPKPSFFAYKLLSSINGQIVKKEANYTIIRMNNTPGGYTIIAHNYSEKLSGLCCKPASAPETAAAISEFNDELDLNITLELESGDYFISKYTFNNNNIFSFMEKLNFPKGMVLAYDACVDFSSTPAIEVFSKEVEKSLDIHFSFKGMDLQTVIIQPIIDEI